MANRIQADFIAYHTRVCRDRGYWTQHAVVDLLQDLLPAFDGIYYARILDHHLLDAIRLIEKDFLWVLEKYGVVPIKTTGKTFDPQYHEAVAIQRTDDMPEGMILGETRRGWTMGNRVLRPAGVRVATKA